MSCRRCSPASFGIRSGPGCEPFVPASRPPNSSWQTLDARHFPNFSWLPQNAIAESQAWYGKVFGAEAGVLNNAPVADLPGVQLRYNKVNVAEGPTKGRVLDHIGFDVKDLKAFIAKMEAAGVKLDADGGYRVNDVGVGIAFVTDPWGTRIELNERPKAVYLP